MNQNDNKHTPILDIRHADVFRGRKKVFEDLNLTIQNGQSTAILGPNGAGKTTLLKVLARELYATGGTVSIYGKSRWNVWELRKKLGIVSDDLQKNYAPQASGRSVVLSGYYSSVDTFGHQHFSHAQLEHAALVSLDLGIASLQDKSYFAMSTGEQRRHLLARAMVNGPETLILDEPTAGLDLTAQFQYLKLISELVIAGKNLILVTHHVHEIPPEVEQVILLKNGTLVLDAEKHAALTSENLSELYDVEVNVVVSNGYYQVVPGSSRPCLGS